MPLSPIGLISRGIACGVLTAELVALKVDVLVAVSNASVRAAQHAITTIPIVFFAADPVVRKVVNSLARPGGNMTGVTTLEDDLSGKHLSLFKEAVPGMTRVALLVPTNDQEDIDQYQTAASTLGVSIEPVEVSSREEFERAFDRIADARLEGIMMPANRLKFQSRTLIARLALMRRLPLMVAHRAFTESGALMSYGDDRPAMFRHMATYARSAPSSYPTITLLGGAAVAPAFAAQARVDGLLCTTLISISSRAHRTHACPSTRNT
jgi:putative ABC transport system substrate-binding protein